MYTIMHIGHVNTVVCLASCSVMFDPRRSLPTGSGAGGSEYDRHCHFIVHIPKVIGNPALPTHSATRARQSGHPQSSELKWPTLHVSALARCSLDSACGPPEQRPLDEDEPHVSLDSGLLRRVRLPAKSLIPGQSLMKKEDQLWMSKSGDLKRERMAPEAEVQIETVVW